MCYRLMEEIQGSHLEASILHHTEAYMHTGFLGPALCQIYQTFHIQGLVQALSYDLQFCMEVRT